MMRVITLPSSLDDRALAARAEALAPCPPPEPLLFDARAAQWATPYGLTALLTLGQAIGEAKLPAPRFTVPESDEVRSYWARAGFFHAAAECFELVGRVPKKNSDAPSDVLLPVTPVRAVEDVHHIVGRIQERAQRILQSELNLEAKATMGFAMALSEGCQNIVEHAGTDR